MRRFLVFVLAIGALFGLTGCGEEIFGTDTGRPLDVVLTCDPNPIVANAASSQVAWSARYEAVLTEREARSGTILYVHGIIFDDATGVQVGSIFYDSSDLKAYVGGDELVPKGEKRVLQAIEYRTSGENKSAATMSLQAKVRSPSGAESTLTILVKVQ